MTPCAPPSTSRTTSSTISRNCRTRKKSLTATVSEVLRAGLAQIAKPLATRRYREKTYDMGPPKVDLTKALRLAGELETEEILRKMEQGK